MHRSLTALLLGVLLLARGAWADEPAAAPGPDRWTLLDSGGIAWDVANDKRLPHGDHIEMSGRLASVILRYGVNDKGELTLTRRVVWPTLRTIPNNTHGSLIKDWPIDVAPKITVDGKELGLQKPFRMELKGALAISSHTDQDIDVTRTIFAPVQARAEMEQWTLTNKTDQPREIVVEPLMKTDYARGTVGLYVLEAQTTAPVGTESPATTRLAPGQSYAFGITLSGRRISEPRESWDIATQLDLRRSFVSSLAKSLVLETPDPVLNRAFDFAKLRAAESIFETKAGLLHSPGGSRYYAAVWCNDQVEYAGPFFAFLGNDAANEASLNAYRLYVPFMGPEYRMIPSSIIAEGLDIWEGAGDRGDAAMYAYGASHFVLTRGDRKIAEELYPAIAWCLEYCKRQMTDDGVIKSKTDELENRFPTGGKPNLSTSTLAYGGLRGAANLARALGKSDDAREYDQRADALAAAIEKHFGADLEGFHTYRYNEGNANLRSWICLPLTMGLMDRKSGTIDALFSPRLWTVDGVATQAGDKTFWDRSTLYAFRGAFNAGETERVMPYLTAYTRRRLLGDHVPYPVEAFPEGEQRHLSAESALFCRAIIEGLFGVKPTGLKSFAISPRPPQAWPNMALRSVSAFGHTFDMLVARDPGGLKVTVSVPGAAAQERIVPEHGTAEISLP